MSIIAVCRIARDWKLEDRGVWNFSASESVSRSVVSEALQPYRLKPSGLYFPGILQARILE